MSLLEFIKMVISIHSMERISAIATAIAAIFAWRTSSMNKKQIKDQNEEQHRVERPRLAPLNKDVLINNFNGPMAAWNLLDQLDDEDLYRIDELDSFYFTLINTGKSFALKVELTFELIGGIDSIEEVTEPTFSLLIDNPSLKQVSPESFTFTFKKNKDANEKHFYSDRPIQYTVDAFKMRIPLLKSNESLAIRPPRYFALLNNLNLLNFTSNKPQLKLSIKYVDQYHVKHIDIYTMQLKQNTLFIESNQSRKEEYYLDFEHIQS